MRNTMAQKQGSMVTDLTGGSVAKLLLKFT